MLDTWRSIFSELEKLFRQHRLHTFAFIHPPTSRPWANSWGPSPPPTWVLLFEHVYSQNTEAAGLKFTKLIHPWIQGSTTWQCLLFPQSGTFCQHHFGNCRKMRPFPALFNLDHWSLFLRIYISACKNEIQNFLAQNLEKICKSLVFLRSNQWDANDIN